MNEYEGLLRTERPNARTRALCTRAWADDRSRRHSDAPQRRPIRAILSSSATNHSVRYCSCSSVPAGSCSIDDAILLIYSVNDCVCIYWSTFKSENVAVGTWWIQLWAGW